MAHAPVALPSSLVEVPCHSLRGCVVGRGARLRRPTLGGRREGEAEASESGAVSYCSDTRADSKRTHTRGARSQARRGGGAPARGGPRLSGPLPPPRLAPSEPPAHSYPARARVRPTDTRVTETRYDNNALFRDADRLREPSHVSNRTRGACDTPIRHRPNKSSRASHLIKSLSGTPRPARAFPAPEPSRDQRYWRSGAGPPRLCLVASRHGASHAPVSVTEGARRQEVETA